MNNKHIEDFNTALNIYENDYSHDDLINFLKNGSDVEKQVAAIKLDRIENQTEADIFMSNLTGCDGKIREAISFRLKDFIQNNPALYIKYSDIFIEAVIDINGNICRNTISSLTYLKIYPEFCKNLCSELTKRILPLAKTIKAFDIQEGKYKINKEIFKLYWYLETLSQLNEFCNETDLKQIISETSDIQEYTIREKTAKILSVIKNDDELLKIKSKLKEDSNYYVRRI